MAQGSFTAQVSAEIAKQKRLMEAVYKEAAQRTIEVMQTPVGAGGNLPIDTGYMRASLMVSLGTGLPSTTDKPKGASAFSYDAGETSLKIAGAEISDPITAVYQASYARHVNYGARGRAGRQFVGLAAQQWPRIVTEVCREAQSRAN